MPNIKIVIRGSSDTEINALRQSLPPEGIDVSRRPLNAIGGIREVIEIIFEDFSVFYFARDFVIAEALNKSIPLFKKVVKYFRNKNVIVNHSTYSFKMVYRSNVIHFNIVCSPDKLEEGIDLFERYRTDSFLSGLWNGCIVTIKYEEIEGQWYIGTS